MRQVMRVLRVAAMLGCAFAPPADGADVQVNIGVPAAPHVLVAPQPFVVVPDVPAVRYAPENPLDVFLYEDRYYAWQDGWFITPKPGEPWVYVAPEHVPRTILMVPARYYKKVPPGQLKKQSRGVPPGHAKHRDKGKGRDSDDDDR